MDADFSKKGLLDFLSYLERKGMMKASTVNARKRACAAMLEVLDENEAADLRNIDVESLAERFSNIRAGDFTPGSMQTYKSRFSGALGDFFAFREDPLKFKPGLSPRTRRRKASDRSDETNTRNDEGQVSPQSPSYQQDFDAVIFPIPLRSNLIVRIANLPSDLTLQEADKIKRVIDALIVTDQ